MKNRKHIEKRQRELLEELNGRQQRAMKQRDEGVADAEACESVGLPPKVAAHAVLEWFDQEMEKIEALREHYTNPNPNFIPEEEE